MVISVPSRPRPAVIKRKQTTEYKSPYTDTKSPLLTLPLKLGLFNGLAIKSIFSALRSLLGLRFNLFSLLVGGITGALTAKLFLEDTGIGEILRFLIRLLTYIEGAFNA